MCPGPCLCSETKMRKHGQRTPSGQAPPEGAVGAGTSGRRPPEGPRLTAAPRKRGCRAPNACGSSPRGAEKPKFAFSSVPRDAAQPSRHTDSENLTELPISKASC
uniref:Uncharacterized protein n=1 Tax=Rangifer tarandus platyrhynchus TaxID=3082113 RepID=A0ACB0EIM5_RANTA|nr:unnamed protein product [Rangifer tarandus platyrhynchus]